MASSGIQARPTVVSPAISPGEQIQAGPGRSIVIGTHESAALLVQQLDLIPDRPGVLGCVLLDGEPQAACGCVLGTVADLSTICRSLGVDHAILSIPRERADAVPGILARLDTLGVCTAKVSPLGEQLDSANASLAVGVARARLDLADLIGREPNEMDAAAVGGLLRGRRVLITGAGGSIGTELSLIAARFEPSRLILVERAENALFEIDRRLGSEHPGVRRRAVLHDVVDEQGTLRLFEASRPEIVFHAAAHKHVPLMEDHPAQAITNNVFGTRSVVEASLAVGARRFVMISTDKAVRPRSVMGATKRLAEVYVRWAHGRSDRERTRCCMVRFGNVLGSACSVLPIWSAQLAEGGPIGVTDPRMTRYFMTINEAASLVIQSALLSGREDPSGPAELFVLDMGEPVRVLDLAQRFIRAHGLEAILPGDASGGSGRVRIVVTGARPGEKLHEQLSYRAEHLQDTGHPGIRAWAGPIPIDFDPEAMIADLDRARGLGRRGDVLECLSRYIPEIGGPQAGRSDSIREAVLPEPAARARA